MKQFAQECISLGLSLEQDKENIESLSKKTKSQHSSSCGSNNDTINDIIHNEGCKVGDGDGDGDGGGGDHSLAFYCCTKNEKRGNNCDNDHYHDHDQVLHAYEQQQEERSVLQAFSKFDPVLNEVAKTVFLVNKEKNSGKMRSLSLTSSSSDTISTINDETRKEKQEETVEYGRLINNKALSSVFLLDNVLLPLLRQQGAATNPGGCGGSSASTSGPLQFSKEKSTQKSNLRSSLHLTYAKKFASRVCRFTEQYEKGVRLHIPRQIDWTNATNQQQNVDTSTIESFKKAAREWVTVIDNVTQTELQQPHIREKNNPMAEVDFWRRRHVVLSDVLEQVQSVEIKFVIDTLGGLDDSYSAYDKLKDLIIDLTKLSVEATENAKFLSTLERHLRTLNDGSLDAVVGIVPSLLDGMRMVWSVSRYYNRDERMVPLMEMIANQIASRVKLHVKLDEIMKLSRDEATNLVKTSKCLLEVWRESYMETRARIQNMGQGRRWEFDRAKLFEATNYMVEICSNVTRVIETIDELNHIFSPDLVRVTGKNGNVVGVMEDAALLPKLFIEIKFDPFDSSTQKNWNKIMYTFDEMVLQIESSACKSIEKAFRQLRSCEDAYHLVQRFKTMKARPSIHRVIDERYQDIFQQYEKELETIEDYFMKHKDEPPITFAYQTASGSIAWAHDLYLRAKRPILLFNGHGGLLETGFGFNLKNTYLAFAKTIDKYKHSVHSNWNERARIVSNQCLQTPLLSIIGDQSSVADTYNTKDFSQGSAQQEMPSMIQIPTELSSSTKNSSLFVLNDFENGVRLQANYSDTVRELIQEATYFDSMGFSIPEGAMHLALQRHIFDCHAVDLCKFTRIFNLTFDNMSSIEFNLMDMHINHLKKTLAPGLSTLNWSSQRITNYITSAFHAIENFQSKLREVRKHFNSLESLVGQIEKESLVETHLVNSLTSIGDLIGIIESSFEEKISKCVLRYEAMSPILIKIELVVTESDSGSSPLLRCTYHYWTKRVHNALVEMIIRSLISLFSHIRALHSKSHSCHFHFSVYEKVLVTEPTLSDIKKYFDRCSTLISQCSKLFSRWMHHTCLDAFSHSNSSYSLKVKREYSFCTDISKNSTIVSTLTGLNQGLLTLIRNLRKFSQHMTAIFDSYNIKSDTVWKSQLNEKIHDNCSVSVFDTLMRECDNDLNDVQHSTFEVCNIPLSLSSNLGLFRGVDVSEVKDFLIEAISERKLDISEALHTIANQNLDSIKKSILEYGQMLSSEPTSFDELKLIINSIRTILRVNMSMEIQCKDVKEKYEVLKDRGVYIPEEEIYQAFASYTQWYNLVIYAKTINLRLEDHKNEFKKHLETEQADFIALVHEERTNFCNEGPGSASMCLDSGLAMLDRWTTKLEHLQSIKDDLSNSEDIMEKNQRIYPDFDDFKTSSREQQQIFTIYKMFAELIETQKGTTWQDANLHSFRKNLDIIMVTMKGQSRQYSESLWNKVNSKIDNMIGTLPLLGKLQTDAMKDRHWEKLLIASESAPRLKFSLQHLSFQAVLKMNLLPISAQIEEILNLSLHEQKIEKGLLNIENHWMSINLQTKSFKGASVNSSLVLTAIDDIFIHLEDHMLNLQTMLTSKFSAFFRDAIKEWEKHLDTINDCLNCWIKLQQKWMYLESIFVGTDDIRTQLPKEGKKFDETSAHFQSIMRQTHEVSDIMNACHEDRLETLHTLLETLEKCQKSLSEYLNHKRAVFSRFYFISDDDMISILGVADPSAIQPHMMKLFENTKSLKISQSHNKITHFHSSEGETIELKHEIDCSGPVEIWMRKFDEEVKHTLHQIMKESIFNYTTMSQKNWIVSTLGMCTISASQIWWTWCVEDAFHLIEVGQKQALQGLEIELSVQLNDMVTMTRSLLSPNVRKKINSLLIINVHARDVVSSFVRDSIQSAQQFEWESQLRFYWNKDENDLIIKQCLGVFRFGYEYLGLSGRLVVTPLTDRCYITLTQALTFNLGGSPSGPAGTGKTETVKCLAKALGVPCFVINCGDGLDYLSMASIFAGLLQSGAWGCFDEFNRINIEVLSVVSSQLKLIQNAMIAGIKNVNIGIGADIPIKRVNGCTMSGIFITMNPGYVGRTELPDNLKSLFRPVAMVSPDVHKITENILFSEGFFNSKSLGRKIVAIYKLAKEQLSKQYHYDFGLRSMKSVLELAGKMKRGYPNLPEEQLMILVLKNANMSRFVYEDAALFCDLIGDLFPGVAYPLITDDLLVKAIHTYLVENSLDCQENGATKHQVDKVLHLHETQKARHSTMIVGPTSGGKSTIMNTLIGSLKALDGTNVKMSVINPKAQDLNELYGSLDVLTRDWVDGIIPHIFRTSNQTTQNNRLNDKRWIVFDGDVDAIWVENLNSVMDDNRLLTIPNGERIRLQPHCSLLYEVCDLQYASPATISRCGMVWVDPKNLGYKPFFHRWLQLRYSGTNAASSQVLLLFQKYAQPCIDYVLNENKTNNKLSQVIKIQSIEVCKQLCNFLEAFLPPKEEGPGGLEVEFLSNIFIFCVLHGIGGVLDAISRKKFNQFILDICDYDLPANLFNHFYCQQSRQWLHLDKNVHGYNEPKPFCFHKVFVPTKTTSLYQKFLEKLSNHSPVLVAGVSGTAKTILCQNFVSSLPDETFSTLNIHFSSMISGLEVKKFINPKVEKRMGSIYGAPAGKKLTLFIDDMHLPKVDENGTRQPIALLLTLLDHGFYHSSEKGIERKVIQDINMIGTTIPSSMGGDSLDPRFVSKHTILHIPKPSEEELYQIFSQVLNTSPEISCNMVADLTKITIQCYSRIHEKLQPSPTKFHYNFTIKDLSRVFEGICSFIISRNIDTASIFRLWCNEINRVFCDRLITESDLCIASNIIHEVLKSRVSNNHNIHDITRLPLLYINYESMKCVSEEVESTKEQETNYDTMNPFICKIIDDYNISNKNKQVSLVPFDFAIDHFLRIVRVLKFPKGHVLLVGLGGSGKKSLTKIAGHAMGFKVYELGVTQGYSYDEFCDDLRKLLKLAMIQPMVFLLPDDAILDERYLEQVCFILSLGMPPGLFEKDEILAICQENGCEENDLIDICKNNIHVVFTMTPSGDILKKRCRNFPALLSNCVIDWFYPWPKEALKMVAKHVLDNDSSFVSALGSNLNDISTHATNVHFIVNKFANEFSEQMKQHYQITPKIFINYLETFVKEVKNAFTKNHSMTHRLNRGLETIHSASRAIAEMKLQLDSKKIVVDRKTVGIEELIASIHEKTSLAKKSSQEASKKREAAAEQGRTTKIEKDKADSALMEALPAVEAAADALSKIRREDLQELKAFNNPPIHVKIVCQMCTVLRPTREKLDETWNDSKKILGNTKLLDMLKEYPKENMTERMYQRCKDILQDNKKHDISVENMSTKSQAGKGLLVWVFAILKYYEVAKNVHPLKERVKEMQKAQARTEKELNDLATLLGRLSSEIVALEKKYDAAKKELSELQVQASQMQKRLDSASVLIFGLEGEQKRWKSDHDRLISDKSMIIGNFLVFSCFQSYLGAFNHDFRRQIITHLIDDLQRLHIPCTPDFRPHNLVSTTSELQNWFAKGLSKDDFSVQNGVLIMKASRFPLCIDPQEQALKWIKNLFKSTQLTIKSHNDPDYLRHLELAVEFGNPFILENVGNELDSILDNILNQNFMIENGTKKVCLGDKIIEWDDGFRLFLCSKARSPKFPPEIISKINLINYSITKDGVRDQLLNIVVNNERPELGLQLQELVNIMTNNSSKLTQLEDLLLKELATSNGNILDNNSLLCTLQETRENALIIKSKLEECQCTKNIIEEVRESYKDVSQRGSSLYFASAGLSAINNMYELSLENFIEQFQIGLQNTEDNEDVSIRVKNLISSCSNRLYKFTCLGIFEQHRLTYSLNLAITILKEKDINMLETSMVAYFIKGSTAAGATNEDVPSCLNWLSSDSWNLLVQIAQYNNKFDQLKKCCTELKFLNWVQSSEPERSLPPLDSIFTKFELLCLVRIFRPDRCFNAIKLFIADSIGEEFVQSPTLDYEEVYNESSSRCPIILILSKGADPQSNLQNLGNQIGCKVAFVSLGQGQGKVANRMLGSAFRNGHWIVIQNCHLLLQWVHQLDTQLQHLGAPHSKFRLWLTTEPSPQFPVYLLQRSYKIVMEPPDGMRLNMQSTLINVNRSLIESCENPQIYPLLYSLTYLHAALQERKKFGKLGWNVPYDFNDSDFSISLQLFCAYLSRSSTEGIDGIPWESLKFLIGSAMYGGRVSDNMDRRVLQTYFNEYFGDFVLRGGQTFQFSKIHSTYILPSSTVPSRSKLESYKDNINMMPTNTRPAVLGLHYKAEAMYFSDRMDKTLSALAMTLTDIVEKKNVQLEHEENIAKVVEIIGSIPISNPETGPFDINRIREEVISRNEMKILTPYDIVLLQELDYWNQLCLCMYMTMNDLLQALQGERGMNDQIEHTLQLLNEGSLPAVWMKYCPPTTKKLSSWMIHFKQRSEQYVSWVESGQPQVIWLSGLHSPQGFLSALLQTVCRSKGWALDETVIHTEVTKWTHEDMMNGNISLDNKSSIFVRGLYLEGAAWDTENSKLTNESFNSDNNSLNTDLPLVRLVPMQKTSLSKHQNLLAVPVYLTRFRRGVNGEGLVFEAFLDTDIHHSFWILQGIAILMNLD